MAKRKAKKKPYFDLDSKRMHYRSELEAYLKSLGLPFSHPTIISYEKKGIIPSPRMRVGAGIGRRAYTAEEMIEIGNKLKSHIS